MKITNASSKTIELINGKRIQPKKTVNITVPQGSDLYEQIKGLQAQQLIEIAE